MNYDFAMERQDLARIDKLNTLSDISTFWNDVRKMTKRVTSDHSIGHWQAFAEMRFKELIFEPRQRTALDGKTWWYVWDKRENTWSTYISHGKYKTKKECQFAILQERII